MKFLFDQNLSRRLVGTLSEAFPGCVHVALLGMDEADDRTVWRFAAENGAVIVTKDADFHQMSFALGPPPKVIWIRRGNCSTREVAELLLRHRAAIETFVADGESAFLAIS